MNIIPAIDIIEGKCVRLTKGDYSTRKIYNENPLEVALQFQDNGVTHLHLVDLDGAKASHVVNWKVLEKIASKTTLQIDFGGGIKTEKDLQIVFDCGAAQATAGSIAIKNKPTVINWLTLYGSDKIIIGADVLEKKIAVSGWKEQTEKKIIEFLHEYKSHGMQYCICTDISKDGMLQGPSVDLYNEILSEIKDIKLIASGGISSMDDLYILKERGLYAAIVGKAIYENKISLRDIKNYNSQLI